MESDDDDQYDDFGNFVGDALSPDWVSSHSEENGLENTQLIEESLSSDEESQRGKDGVLVSTDNLREPFEGAETIYVDPTSTGKDEPLIKLIAADRTLEYKLVDDELPRTRYCKEYLIELSRVQPERIRNVAVVGGLHVGKTSFLDTLVMETHPEICPSKLKDQNGRPMRYLDTHKLEDERGISIRVSALSLLLQDPRDRSYPVNFIDCPGHPDFQDEVDSALGVVEGAVFIVDLLEGISSRDKRILTKIMKNNLPFVVVLNKFDRLILELRLPPKDFYLKIRHTLDDINSYVYHNEYSFSYTHDRLVSPLKNNVVFASYDLRTSFTLRTWSQLYELKGGLPNVEMSKFERTLWGNICFRDGGFCKLPSSEVPCTFETFIVEPIYKLITHSLVAGPKENILSQLLWENFRTSLPKASYKKDPQDLLREVFSRIFQTLADFTHTLVNTISSPKGQETFRRKYPVFRKDSDDPIAEVFAVRWSSPLNECQSLARVLQGTFKVGQKVHIFSEDGERKLETISALYLCCGRYKISVDQASMGSIVMISGLGDTVSKSATIFDSLCSSEKQIPFHCLRNGARSVYKVAVECECSVDLPRMVRGLRTLSRVYAGAIIKLEDSGEYTILGTGELFLDCFLHDLRYLTPDYLSIKVSDAMVRFSETCQEQSVTKLSASSLANQNRISIIAEPLKDQHLSCAIEHGQVTLSQPQKVTAKILREEFEWDSLAARSLWCMGPKGLQFPSLLLDDSLEAETNKDRLLLHKDSINAGFNLGINEGPLCGEAIRDTKFKILDAVLNSSSMSSSSQIIPMTRNAMHIGFLTAVPRLLEPVYKVSTICTYNCLSAIHTLLDKRRGWAVKERAIVATKMYEIEGYVPVIDSVGLDVDIRLATQGQAFCTMEFCRWDVVPGDPLDKDCHLPTMKPVPRASLARDFVLKTRRRKGLGGEPNLQKYIDPELFAKLRESGIVL